jgi:GT2 family glycosyltransferase
MSSAVDILIPTCNRPYALAMTLTSLSSQTQQDMHIHVSDQSDSEDVLERPEVQAVCRLLNASGRRVQTWRHLPRQGMAEQRAFLLSKVTAPYCLFLDDDVLLENDLVERLLQAIKEQQCGFVGSALHGLSYAEHVRPHQQHIEFWEGPVEPEMVMLEGPGWERYQLHNAANLFHVQQKFGMTRDNTRYYRVAWIGGCVLFDTVKLRATGGFDFWQELPPQHCGEDVLAQLRVMERYGGCGIIPSGAYHMELPTTVKERPVDAPHVLWREPRPQPVWGQHA